MSPTADDGALIITSRARGRQPSAWRSWKTSRAPCRGSGGPTWASWWARNSIDASATERPAVLARVAARRARRVDGEDAVPVLVWTGW